MASRSKPWLSPLSVDVMVHWRGELFAARRIQGEAEVAVGDAPGSLARIPCDALGVAGFALARVAGRSASVRVPEGVVATRWRAGGAMELVAGPADTALKVGETIEYPLGAFFLRVSAALPERAAERPARRFLTGAFAHVALAALAHFFVLGAAAHAAQASQLEDGDDDRRETIRGLLVSAEQRAAARDPILFNGFGSKDGVDINRRSGDGRDGGGEKAAGDAGAMGDALSTTKERRRYAVPERTRKDPERALSKSEALRDAAEFGMIGLLPQDDGKNAPAAPWSDDDDAHGADKLAALGGLWGPSAGTFESIGGLSLSGIGEGGGGRGEGIGLGTIGDLGHVLGLPGDGTGGGGTPAVGTISSGGWGGPGHLRGSRGIGHLRGSHRVKTPIIRCYLCYGSVSGRLPPEAVQRIVRANFGRFRSCYARGLQQNPTLTGTVTTRFVIGRDGAVSSAQNGGSTMTDPEVVACVVRAFYGLSFPQPEGGIVTVTYPIAFSNDI